jgi:endonuclease/exonuclease/phosphatase family metal-dependent hydrolase
MATRRWIRWLPWLMVAGLLLYGVLRHQFAGPGDPSWQPPPAPEAGLRIATWNLENFPRPEQDLQRVGSELDELDADVIAVQEVRDEAALRRLLPEHELHLTRAGGRGHQRLGLAFDPRRLELVGELVEDDRLSLGGRVRPAAIARLRERSGPSTFTVVVVHLKATPEGFDERRQQWSTLRSIVADTAGEPVFVVGDFNATGSSEGSPIGERTALAETLEPARLRWIPVVGGCTAYWQGVRHDAWLEPSLLDMIWVSPHVGAEQSHAGGACARHACRPLRSTDTYPDPDAQRASDHCPVWVDVTSWAPSGVQ